MSQRKILALIFHLYILYVRHYWLMIHRWITKTKKRVAPNWKLRLLIKGQKHFCCPIEFIALILVSIWNDNCMILSWMKDSVRLLWKLKRKQICVERLGSVNEKCQCHTCVTITAGCDFEVSKATTQAVDHCNDLSVSVYLCVTYSIRIRKHNGNRPR